MNYQTFHDTKEMGCAIILTLDLKSKPVTIVGEYINFNFDPESITVKIVEASDFFKPGYECTFSMKYVIAFQQGPKMFDNYRETQLKYWQSQLKNPHFEETAKTELKHYEKYGWFSS